MTENERVREIRKAKSLTLEKFGERIGMGKSAISDIERGRNALSNQARLAICREYNINEEWLRTGEGEMYVQRSREESLEKELRDFFSSEPDAFRERLIRILLRLPAEHWDILAEYAQQLAGENTEPRPEPMTLEEEVRAEAEEFYKMRLEEKKRELSTSNSDASVSEIA